MRKRENKIGRRALTESPGIGAAKEERAMERRRRAEASLRPNMMMKGRTEGGDGVGGWMDASVERGKQKRVWWFITSWLSDQGYF